MQEELVDALNNPPAVEVDIPIFNAPVENFLPLEIQEDIMVDDEIQQQLEEEAA
jgi:hypothetical protein